MIFEQFIPNSVSSYSASSHSFNLPGFLVWRASYPAMPVCRVIRLTSEGKKKKGRNDLSWGQLF